MTSRIFLLFVTWEPRDDGEVPFHNVNTDVIERKGPPPFHLNTKAASTKTARASRSAPGFLAEAASHASNSYRQHIRSRGKPEKESKIEPEPPIKHQSSVNPRCSLGSQVGRRSNIQSSAEHPRENFDEPGLTQTFLQIAEAEETANTDGVSSSQTENEFNEGADAVEELAHSFYGPEITEEDTSTHYAGEEQLVAQQRNVAPPSSKHRVGKRPPPGRVYTSDKRALGIQLQPDEELVIQAREDGGCYILFRPRTIHLHTMESKPLGGFPTKRDRADGIEEGRKPHSYMSQWLTKSEPPLRI
ncbi:MAG: hypothetical protein Q9227_005797 [Pyrenula ochraceoflavens]